MKTSENFAVVVHAPQPTQNLVISRFCYCFLNARAQLIINLLLGDVLIAVVVVVCLSTLITYVRHHKLLTASGEKEHSENDMNARRY